MEDEIINDNQGFHGRLTQQPIRLQSFNLLENYLYLKDRDISHEESILYYMVFGGVAYYLNFLQTGSFQDNINLLFNDFLKDEFENIFRALFSIKRRRKTVKHQLILEVLADHNGLTKQKIAEKTKINLVTLTGLLKDLTLSGFIKENNYFNQKIRDSVYYYIDLFSFFYIRWFKKKGFIFNSQSFKIWQGYTFEILCMNQVNLIKQLAGFSAIPTTEYSWFKKENKQADAQIDLIIDRSHFDQTIFLVECKHYNVFNITKDVIDNLKNKRKQFTDYLDIEKTANRK